MGALMDSQGTQQVSVSGSVKAGCQRPDVGGGGGVGWSWHRPRGRQPVGGLGDVGEGVGSGPYP